MKSVLLFIIFVLIVLFVVLSALTSLASSAKKALYRSEPPTKLKRGYDDDNT